MSMVELVSLDCSSCNCTRAKIGAKLGEPDKAVFWESFLKGKDTNKL